MSRILLLILILMPTACSRDGATGKVNITFTNISGTALADPGFADPTVFKIRPLFIQLMTIADGPGSTGEHVVIWASKNCSPEKGKVEKDGKTYDWYQPGNCTANAGDELVDLTKGADSVNQIFNSQSWEVIPGEFNFASIAFCGDPNIETNTTIPTVVYQAGSMTGEQELVNCSAWATPTNGPLVINEGDSVTVDFGYDLDSLVRNDTFNPPLVNPISDGWCGYSPDGTESYCPSLGQDAFQVKIK